MKARFLPPLSFCYLPTYDSTVIFVVCHFFKTVFGLHIVLPFSKAFTPITSCRSHHISLASSRKPVSSRLVLNREEEQFWTLSSADPPFLFFQRVNNLPLSLHFKVSNSFISGAVFNMRFGMRCLITKMPYQSLSLLEPRF